MMAMVSIGDLAQSAVLRRQNLQLRQEVDRLAQEVTTGLSGNIAKRLNGDFTYLSDIERKLGALKSFHTAALEAGFFTTGMQNALDQVQQSGATLAPALLASASSGFPTQSSGVARAASDALAQSVAALNTQVAGRSLFSGNATDSPSLAQPSVIMTALSAAVGGETSASGIVTRLDDWFAAPGGGFNTVAYLGSDEALGPFRIDQSGQVDLDLRADTPVLRDFLKFNALAVISTDPAFALDKNTQAQLQRIAGEGLMEAETKLVGLRSDLGYAEARIEEGRVRLETERTSLELVRNALISVDPYEAATRLEQAQTQLESLYAVTVRLSRLSLAEFLR